MAKKIWEQLQEEEQQHKEYAKQKQQETRQKFEEISAKNKNKQSSTIGSIQNAYKGLPQYNKVKNSLNNYYNNQKKSEPSIWDRMQHVMKSFGTGITQGSIGVAQSGLTDIANEMQEGKDKKYSNILNDALSHNSSPTGMANMAGNSMIKGISTIADKDKSLWQKITDLGLNATEEGKRLLPGYNIVSGTAQLLGKIGKENDVKAEEPLLEANKKLQNVVDEKQRKLYEEGKKYDGVTRILGEASHSIGNMTPSIVASAVTKNPNIGLGVMGASVKGQATNEALKEGQELQKATQIGDAKALIEVLTEKISGGAKIFGKGNIDDVAEDFIKNKAKSKFGKFLMKQGYNTLGEITEEEISNVVDNIIDKGTVDPEKRIIDLQEGAKTAGQTALTTTLLNILTGGMVGDYKSAKYQTQQEENAQNWINKAQDIVNQENTQQLPQQQNKNAVETNVVRENVQKENNIQKDLNKSSFSFDKINSKITSDSNVNKLTDDGIIMTYVHMKNQNTQNYGNTYGQNIEPAGQYMNVDTMQGKYKVPGAEYGKIKFDKPLVLDHINTGETGWKKTLSDMFNHKTGKELTNEIKKAGYDGIITVDEDGYYNEVVNINGNKIDNLENNQNTLYNNSNEMESDINGQAIKQNDQGGIERLSEYTRGESNNGRYQENNEKQKFRTKQEDIEYAINPNNHLKNLNEGQQKIKKAFEEKGVKLNYYDNESRHGGFYTDNNLLVNTNNATLQEQKNEAIHEYAHHLIRDDAEFNSKVIPIADKIIKNESNETAESIRNYIMQKGENITVDEVEDIYKTVIEEMLADYAIDISNKVDFNNENRYGIDKTILNDYKNLIEKHLPNINIENSNESSFNLPTKQKPNLPSPGEDINPYRNTAKANKLIKEKNEKVRQLNNDLQQITSEQGKNIIQQEINNIEKEYNNKIQKLYDEINNKNNDTDKPTRHDIIQENRELARENILNIANWKDKKSGLRYQLETMERNMYDIIPDKAEAKKINDTYFEPVHKAEADKQRFINKYNNKIKEFKLNKYESEAVQLLGEQKYNPDFKAEDVQDILDRVNKNIENGKINQEKVNNAIETFRNIYDELFELENSKLRENGYKEKPYRKGYFPHFVDYVPETKTEKVLEKLGFKIDKRPLPTDIAGITEQFVPGKTWNKSALQRKTNKTDYNALKGFDTYIAQASDNIFHTDNIQRLRGLENEIRYQYSDKGIQERVDNILNDETLFEEEKQDLINNIFEQVDNPMPNLVTELRRYTNALANKKSEADRSIENMIGRQTYSTVNAIENRFGANAVGLNIGSAFTNFIPITQAYSQVSTKNMTRAFFDTVKSYANNDGFVDNSTFLTNRLNKSEKLYKTSLEKISDKTSFLFNAIDDVTSNIVTRGKYLQNIEDGMTEIQAMQDADRFAANVIADRSKGALPTKFEEKNPITKMLSQFQLEVNNQYRYMFKDLPRDMGDEGLGAIATAFLKMFIGAWLYNKASEKMTGRKPAFSPIDLVKSGYDNFTDENKGTYDKIASTTKEVGEQLPFVGGLIGGGRIPINGAIPNVANITKAGVGLATGEMDSKKATKNIRKELEKPLYYILPPFGGSQFKKTVEGIKTVKQGGSYGVDNKGRETLQFPVENPKAKDYIKAGVFGKYALPMAKDYTESGYKSLNASQTKAYKESKIPYKEYMEYLNQDFKKNEDKINYLKKQKWSTAQKWGIYTNEIFSDKERKDGGSQLEDAKYAVSNGITKKEYLKLYNETSERKMDMPKKEDIDKLKKEDLSIKKYVEYQIKLHDETKKKKQDKELDENGQLKDKDKIQILLDTKEYSDKDKQTIYENYIKSKPKEGEVDLYKALKENGININQYLNYKQQNLESDKEDDGTLNGKSISGSKKEKLYEYVNNNISGYTNRLLILGSQYKLSKNERQKVYETINDLPNTTHEEKLKLLNKMKGFTVYKDGTVKF